MKMVHANVITNRNLSDDILLNEYFIDLGDISDDQLTCVYAAECVDLCRKSCHTLLLPL